MPPAPDGPDGMDNVLRFQVTAAGENGLPRWQPALPGDDLLALFENGRPAGTVNGTINTTSTHQAGTGCVDYGVSRLFSDIPLNEQQPASTVDDDFHLGPPFRTGSMVTD